jgi:hypothetical protein
MYTLLEERQLSRRTPVLDHSDCVLFEADRAKAWELMQQDNIDIIGTGTRIKAIRFRGPDASLLRSGSRKRRELGQPHRSENYWNVRGCWHIDRVPDGYADLFRGVLLNCLV